MQPGHGSASANGRRCGRTSSSGFLVIPLLIWHVVSRPGRPKVTDVDRRAFVRLGTVAAAGVGFYLLQDVVTRTAGLAGGRRRHTGSHEVASFDPAGMPTVIWLDDQRPAAVDPQRWDLRVGGRAVSIDELWERSRPVVATLDCTGGWWSEQLVEHSQPRRTAGRPDGPQRVRAIAHRLQPPVPRPRYSAPFTWLSATAASRSALATAPRCASRSRVVADPNGSSGSLGSTATTDLRGSNRRSRSADGGRSTTVGLDGPIPRRRCVVSIDTRVRRMSSHRCSYGTARSRPGSRSGRTRRTWPKAVCRASVTSATTSSGRSAARG